MASLSLPRTGRLLDFPHLTGRYSFFVVIGAALSGGGVVEAFLPFVAYALGMGAVLGAVAIATTLLKAAAVQKLMHVSRYVEQLGSVLLIGAGGYLIYYQLTTGLLLTRGL